MWYHIGLAYSLARFLVGFMCEWYLTKFWHCWKLRIPPCQEGTSWKSSTNNRSCYLFYGSWNLSEVDPPVTGQKFGKIWGGGGSGKAVEPLFWKIRQYMAGPTLAMHNELSITLVISDTIFSMKSPFYDCRTLNPKTCQKYTGQNRHHAWQNWQMHSIRVATSRRLGDTFFG